MESSDSEGTTTYFTHIQFQLQYKSNQSLPGGEIELVASRLFNRSR